MSLDPLTVISALVAILVIWKLRSVLGQHTGAEKPPANPFIGRSETGAPQRGLPAPPAASPVRLPGAPFSPTDENRWRPHAEAGTVLASGLGSIAAADPAFSLTAFLDGAKVAYERVVTAFSAGDRHTLKSLLARDVYSGFDSALSARERRQETMSTTFVSIDNPKVEAASLEGRTARLDVRFVSTQISATLDKDANVVEGSADGVVDVEDVWAFARDVTSRDPNWKLVATRSGH